MCAGCRTYLIACARPSWSGFYPLKETYFSLNYEMCGLTNSHYRGNGHWVNSYPIVSSQTLFVSRLGFSFSSTWWVFGCGLGGDGCQFLFFQIGGCLGVDGGRVFFPALQINRTLGLLWGMEGRGFHGSFMGVKVLELEYKSHLGFISLFNQTRHLFRHICFCQPSFYYL